MSTNNALTDLASALISGSVKVVDLTAPLGPDTPILFLLPFGHISSQRGSRDY